MNRQEHQEWLLTLTDEEYIDYLERKVNRFASAFVNTVVGHIIYVQVIDYLSNKPAQARKIADWIDANRDKKEDADILKWAEAFGLEVGDLWRVEPEASQQQEDASTEVPRGDGADANDVQGS